MKNTISIFACGWLGLPLAQRLIRAGYLVKGSTSTAAKINLLQETGIEAYCIDINKPTSWDADFFASEILLINVPPSKAGGENHPALIDAFAKKAKQHGVQKVVFISSTAVYPANNMHVDELCNEAPEKGNGALLLKTESLLQNEFPNSCTIVRFAGLMGPQRHPGRFFGGKSNLTGAYTPVNFIALEDCIGILLTLIEKNAFGEVFNGCSPHHPTKKEFYSLGASLLNLASPTYLDSPKIDSHKIVDGSKITEKLGYNYQKSNLLSYLTEL